MSFPNTGILDDFNRPNGGLGGNWVSPVDPSGPNSPTIDTNVAIGPNGVYSSAYYDAATFGPDCEAYLSIPAGGTAFSAVALMTRTQNVGTGTYCNYFCDFDAATGVKLSRNYNNGNSGTLYTVAVNADAGDKIGLRTLTTAGNILNEIWHNSNGAGWALIGSYLDVAAVANFPLLARAGFVAFRQWGNATTTRSVDDFGGGNLGLASDTPRPLMGRGATW